MKIGVKVMPRPEVLDSQGRAVADTLKVHGQAVESCRVGKYIELDVEALSAHEALEKTKKLAEFVLYNPLIETYQMEVIE
jgi:phosphoribosylformylglycinamidine synthase subunit PurS